MPYQVFIVQSAVEDFLVIPRASMLPYIKWMRRELEQNPAQAGYQLHGGLSAFRAISRPRHATAVFGFSEDNQEVIIVMFVLGDIELALKRAELIQRFQDMRSSPQLVRGRVPLSDWNSFVTPS